MRSIKFPIAPDIIISMPHFSIGTFDFIISLSSIDVSISNDNSNMEQTFGNS